jgi:hypothetical protein
MLSCSGCVAQIAEMIQPVTAKILIVVAPQRINTPTWVRRRMTLPSDFTIVHLSLQVEVSFHLLH